MKTQYIFLAFIFVLTACVPPTPTPASTATQLPTETRTPLPPTNTPTATLEPWMQSLPEEGLAVASQEGEFLALDAEGNEKYRWDSESGEWVEVVEVGEDGLVHLVDENGLGISYKPEEMYGGDIMINSEMAELLRERYIGVIWARNNLVQNSNFQPGGKYDSFEKFLVAANEGEVSGVCQFESYEHEGPWGVYVRSVCHDEKVALDLREIEFQIPVIRITNMIPEFSAGVEGLVPTRGKYGATREMIDLETKKLTVRLIVKLPGEVNPDLPSDKLIQGLTKSLNDVFSTISQPDLMYPSYLETLRLLDNRISLSFLPANPDLIGVDPSYLLRVFRDPNILNDPDQTEKMRLSDEVVERMKRFVLGDVFLSAK